MAFSESSAGALRRLKYCAITISGLMVAGIVTLMVLARGKGEDIAGIVAPALLVTIVSGVVAVVAALLQTHDDEIAGVAPPRFVDAAVASPTNRKSQI